MKACSAILLFLLLIGGLPGLVIDKISFRANFPLDEAQLLQAANLRTGEEYDPASVNAASEAMQTWLQTRGHPFVRIANPELIPLSQNGMELSFNLEEVVPADQVQVRFNGLRFFSEAKLRSLLLLPEGHTLGLASLPGLMERTLEEYHRRGYLFTAVQLDSLVLDEGFTAWIGIDEGKPFRLEKFFCQGNKYTRDKTLIKLSGLEGSSTITPETLNNARESILRKSYITACQIEPVDPSSVLIRVEEGKMTYLEGVAGFTQQKGKTELTGTLNLRFLNLWGTDRAIAVRWQKAIRNSVLEFTYHESGPASFPLAGDLALYRNVQDSIWIKSSVSAEVYSYHASQRYGLSLASEGISPGYGRPIQISKSNSRSIGAFWRLDSRDQMLNPSRGVQTGIVYRIRHSSSGRRWSNALEVDHTQFLGLARRWTAAAGIHLRSLAEEDSTDFLQYRMGGFKSLRGYREEEFSSWRLAWANLELRYLIGPQSRIYLFYDHGLLARGKDLVKANIFAPGIGIKVNTRLGLLSIEYGLGYREQGFPDLGSGMIHAGIDTAF